MSKTKTIFISVALALVVGRASQAQTNLPANPEAWPPTVDATKFVHYITIDHKFTPVGSGWISNDLQVLTGGDQVTSAISIGGHLGDKTVGQYLNVADADYTAWATEDTIDILIQFYGNSSVLNPDGSPHNYSFLEGALPDITSPSGGSLPASAKNSQWNWGLFRISNGTRASDGNRFVGSLGPGATGGTAFGGVNGGTIRFQGVPGLIVRLIAFGQKGAFGEPAQINVFSSGATCAPEPNTNVASADVANSVTNHLVVLNNLDQTVVYQSNVGPPTDLRRAVAAVGSLMNFGITSNYLGLACNEAKAMKVSLVYYDDPALAGTVFGPEAYATDSLGGTNVYPATQLYTTAGTGQWVTKAWIVPSVDLQGINTVPLQGGPRITFSAPLFISRIDLGVFRTGTNLLAGLDPIPNSYEDPNICSGTYGNYVELDLNNNIQNGLAPGSSGGDQLMVQEMGGPANDQRMAIRPDGSVYHLNFSITDQTLGPSTQDNADLAICVTYYDDPALIGATFYPDAYQSEVGGQAIIKTPGAANAVHLQGTDKWQQAYFEINDMNFSGVNQGPQAAARFLLSAPIYFSDIRYGVIRPCGPTAGVNPVADCAPALLAINYTNQLVQLSWPTNRVGYTLQFTADFGTQQWAPLTNSPAVKGDQNVVAQPVNAMRFYRLAK